MKFGQFGTYEIYSKKQQNLHIFYSQYNKCIMNVEKSRYSISLDTIKIN